MAQQYNEAQLSSFVDQIFKKLERMEKQLLLLSAEAGIPMEDPTASLPPEVVEMVRNGDRMGALRKYRELTGADMAEAQAAIEAI